jgi:CARDB/Secretion system C-terminal sorting domain
MSTSLQSRLKRTGRWLPMALLLPLAAQAQLNYSASNATTVAGTYTDLGTGGTAIATANPDDANSTAQAIGFTFNFNGTAFTQFVLNTNGFIKLGATAPSTADLFLPESATATQIDPFESTNPADVNILAPFNFDLTAGTAAGGTEYRVATTGTAPNRVCTIQWKNVADKTLAYDQQYGSINFQVKLYETTSNVEFVYGTTAQGTLPEDFRLGVVGIKGSSTAQAVMATKASNSAWEIATFITGFYLPTGNFLNFRGTVRPDAGRTYRFVPTVLLSNDAAVTAIYTLGTVSSTYSSPVTAQALVTNMGSAAQTNLAVTLTVSGATTYTNTQTVATLAPGASTTVTFTYPVSATTGTNTLAVSIPADELATNNTQAFAQTVSANTLSYVSGTTIDGSVGAGVAVAGSVIAIGYRTTGAAAVTSVSPVFAGTTTAPATYQVLVYGAAANGQPGTLLYTSPVRPRPAGAAGIVTTETVAIPNITVNGGFFVSLKTIGANNLSVAYQTEVPLRGGTFFYTTTNGTTWTDINTATLNSRLAVNVGLSTVTATRNEALAAAVSVAPNPAHQRFTLGVPAGSLRTASATLANTLGQVVATRQLNLPAAGGSTDFDVSRLAAGIYTLTLQSGNDLVVKRVVVE